MSTILEVIVATCPPVVQTLSCQHIDMALGFLKGHSLASREDPILQVSDKRASSYEAGQVTLSHKHHFNQDDKLFCILLESTESSRHSGSEIPEFIGLRSIHNVNHLLRELKWRRLKLHTLSRCVREKEAEINVADIPFNVDHNVFIMTILNLQDVTDKRVSCQGINKVFYGLLLPLPAFLTKLLIKVVNKCGIAVFSA